MAFDAGMTAAVVHELATTVAGAKIEKIYQPTADEIVLLCRGQSKKLLLTSSASGARVSLTEKNTENPKVPPMFCMQLRKHLTGSVIESFKMHDFERMIELELSSFDEMGFPCKKYLIAEIMGKYSNLIFAEDKDGRKKVLGALKTVDFTTSSKRQVIPGMTYELPPKQDKVNPLTVTAEEFESILEQYPKEKAAEKFILDSFLGISPLVARELAYSAGVLSVPLADIDRTDALWKALQNFRSRIESKDFTPVMLLRNDGSPFEYCFMPIHQYGDGATVKTFDSFGELFDAFYGTREFIAMMHSRCHDLAAVITSAKNKLMRKIPELTKDLAECDKMDTYKLWGDLITASMYMLTKKAAFCEVTNYYSENLETVKIPLDTKITPSQNAAKYFKKYNKLKTAKSHLTEQIEKAKAELDYLESVEALMSHVETEEDILGIRRELVESGYIQKAGVPMKKEKPEKNLRRFETTLGREFFVGRNNMQNDFLTLKYAKRSDFWFHVKGGHGSHVIMRADLDEDPPAEDFTEAAEAAAYYSGFREGQNVAVDYTEARNVKKPAGAAPGKVVYYTNYTAYVTPKKPKEAK